MAKRQRKTYTETERQDVLAAAQKEGLTALQIQKKFGVRPVTYYSWRKKKGLQGLRGRRPAVGATGGVGDCLRHEVNAGGGDDAEVGLGPEAAKIRADADRQMEIKEGEGEASKIRAVKLAEAEGEAAQIKQKGDTIIIESETKEIIKTVLDIKKPGR